MSIKKWERKIDEFMEQTKRIVYSMSDPDNYQPTAIFTVNDNEVALAVVPADKHDVYTVVTNMAFQMQTECIAVCMNSWIVTSPRDEDYEKDENGKPRWVGPMPSQHPNRVEALQIWASYGDKQMQLMLPYDRQKNGKVKNFQKEIRMGFNDEGAEVVNYLWNDAIERMRSKDFKPWKG